MYFSLVCTLFGILLSTAECLKTSSSDDMYREQLSKLIDELSDSFDSDHGQDVTNDVNERIRPVIAPLWKNYIDVEGNYMIPYVISARIQKIQPVVNNLISVFEEFTSGTCVRFVPRDPSAHADYVTFDVGARCWSEKGRVGGNQKITIGRRCVLPRYLAVMLLYALGLGRQKSEYFVDTAFNDPDQELFENFDDTLKNRAGLSTTDIQSVVAAYKCFQPTTPAPSTTVAPSSSCGVPVIKPNSILMPKIVGGSEALPGSYPWQVSIRHRQSDKAFCGASLISSQWVLSAAHCFTYTNNPMFYAAYVGKHHKYQADPGEQRVYFSGVFKHALYNTRTKEHDIALAKLSSPVQMSDKITTVCLPNNLQDLPAVGTVLTVTGWGNTKNTGDNGVLRQVKVPLMDQGLCKSLLPPVKNGMLCAGYRSGGKDACTGDSGGPLVVEKSAGQFSLVGVVSWGIGCGEKDKPGVYTNVAHYLSWMSGIMTTN